MNDIEYITALAKRSVIAFRLAAMQRAAGFCNKKMCEYAMFLDGAACGRRQSMPDDVWEAIYQRANDYMNSLDLQLADAVVLRLGILPTKYTDFKVTKDADKT